MWGSKAESHFGVNRGNPVQEARKAQSTGFAFVDGAKASAQRRGHSRVELDLRSISVAVDVLAQESHLLHAL